MSCLHIQFKTSYSFIQCDLDVSAIKIFQYITKFIHSQQRFFQAVIIRINAPENIIHGQDHVVTLATDLSDVFFRTINVFVGFDPCHFT